MHRTNIYLSETEEAGLDALAAAEGRSRSDVLRAVIDRELNLDGDAALDAALGDMAGELAEAARTLGAGDPDLCTE
ncbi:MAG: ribbon-helix-helix domain-containing protein [Acidimicrobiales bacterium]